MPSFNNIKTLQTLKTNFKKLNYNDTTKHWIRRHRFALRRLHNLHRCQTSPQTRKRNKSSIHRLPKPHKTKPKHTLQNKRKRRRMPKNKNRRKHATKSRRNSHRRNGRKLRSKMRKNTPRNSLPPRVCPAST